ncbi:hypothetical protein HanRHA438_Chr17g0806551 [Helianthus annuus]|nr:hypothetical protein HanRHA438_Chr17g0806551 [Helianthus annuus]
MLHVLFPQTVMGLERVLPRFSDLVVRLIQNGLIKFDNDSFHYPRFLCPRSTSDQGLFLVQIFVFD